MRVLISLLLYCTVLAFVASCNSDNKRIAGHYFGKESTLLNSGNIQIAAFIDNRTTAAWVTDATFIDFFRNGTYTMQLQHFEHGEYTLDQDTIHLHRSDGTDWSLTFSQDSLTEKFTFHWANGSGAEMTRMENSNSSSYPFTLKNNRWRISTEEEESTNMLIDRLQNNLEFAEKVMIWSNEEKLRIRFHNLPGPFKIVANGFELKRPDQTPKWCSTLGEANCQKSYEIALQYFNSDRFHWRPTGNQLERLLDGIRQINRGLDDYREE